MTIRPVRLQLSRRKGFSLQRLSAETNGLPAVNCARPSRWGNPFVTDGSAITLLRGMPVLTIKNRSFFAAELFRFWLDFELEFSSQRDVAGIAEKSWLAICQRRKRILASLDNLRGNNLGCFCREFMPCHADVLLELANK